MILGRDRDCRYYSLYNINLAVRLSRRQSRETPMPCSNSTSPNPPLPTPILPDTYYLGFNYHRQHRSIENDTRLHIMNNSHLRNDAFIVVDEATPLLLPLEASGSTRFAFRRTWQIQTTGESRRGQTKRSRRRKETRKIVREET